MDIRKFLKRTEPVTDSSEITQQSKRAKDSEPNEISKPSLPSPSTSISNITRLTENYDRPFHEKSNQIPCKREKNRTLYFQESWYKKFPWLHYSLDLKGIVCYYCCRATEMELMSSEGKPEDAFISKGFCNWKKAIDKFTVHQNSSFHRQATYKFTHLTKRVDVTSQIVSQHKQEQAISRLAFLKVVRSIKFLLRQGLASRGHREEEGNLM